MFGVGWQELLVIFLVLLIFVGPKKLPEIARSIGKALRDFARAKEEVRRTIEREFSLYSEGEENGMTKSYLEINLRESQSEEDNEKYGKPKNHNDEDRENAEDYKERESEKIKEREN